MKLKLSHQQKKVIKQWFGSSRFTYNKCVASATDIINDSWHQDRKKRKKFERANFITLRNLIVTKKTKKNTGENIGIKSHITHKDEIYETPKEIRAFAVKDAVTSINNLRKSFFKFKSSPKINFRKKKNRFQTIGIPANAIKVNCLMKKVEDKKTKKRKRGRKKSKTKRKITTIISIYSKLLGDVISKSKSSLKIFGEGKSKPKHDIKITYDGLDYWLLVPCEINQKKQKPRKSIVGIDPGIRSFISCYEPDKYFEFKTDTDKIKSYVDKLDHIHSEDGTNNSKRYLLESRRQRHRIDTVHIQIAKFLARRYGTIILGRLERQKFTKDKCRSKQIQYLFSYLSHFKFRERLKLELSKFRNRSLIVTTESYTSKTCGSCGHVKCDLGSAKIFECDKCDYIVDRDINAARNIILITSTFGSEDSSAVHSSECPKSHNCSKSRACSAPERFYGI